MIKVNKLLYTEKEFDLIPKLEEIIFKINIQSVGEFSKGADINEIMRSLDSVGLQYPDQFILNILKKLEREYVLQEMENKWYTCL